MQINSHARNVTIDCLRGVSILMVVATHGALSALPPGIIKVLETPFIIKGYYGVDIFFAISGFLITRNTLRRYGEPRRIDFGQFYAMRAARILPPLLLFLVVMYVLFLIRNADFKPADPSLLYSGLYSALTFQYHQFYFVGNLPGMYAWAPLWSLSIEEIFYFVFPIACFLSRRATGLVGLMIGLICCAPFVRADYQGLFSFWGTADVLSLGCLAAMAAHRYGGHLSRIHATALLVASGIAGTCLVLFTAPQHDAAWAVSLIALCVAVFLFAAVSLPAARPYPLFAPLTAVLARFGTASYEIYLFHCALIIFYHHALDKALEALTLAPEQVAIAGVVATVAMLATLLAFGTLLSRWFSEPMLRRIRALYAPADSP